MNFYKWKPSKAKKEEFKNKMEEIEKFCIDNNISASSTNDSYYFCINGVKYRVSNHSIEASNKAAYNSLGVKVREEYHDSVRDENTIYIHASKTRIIEIYNNLKAGLKLDGRGRVKVNQLIKSESKEEKIISYDYFKKRICESLEDDLRVLNIKNIHPRSVKNRIESYTSILTALKNSDIELLTKYTGMITKDNIKPEYLSQLYKELKYLPMLH